MFVIPSLKEGLPNTVMAAMACGTLVAGFAAAGTADMVRHGVTGRLASGGEGEALAVAIKGLPEDPAGGQEMATRGRPLGLKKYSLEVMGANYTQLLTRALNRFHPFPLSPIGGEG